MALRRKFVGVEVAGPLRLGGLVCRRCGGRAIVWHVVGVARGNTPHYWECEECGSGEIVSGTPMRFVTYQDLFRHSWEEYRLGNGLAPYGQFKDKRLSSDKYEEV